MNEESKIYVAGHRGMVGSSIVLHLQQQGFNNIVTRTHAELDLTNQAAVQAFFAQEKPSQVYLAATKVGGIHANNTYPADFIYQNLMMQANVIEAAFQNSVQKLLFLGSSCIDPRYFRPTEVETLLGDPTKAKQKLGWVPEITLDQMIEEMVAADLAEAKKHALLKKHGYDVSVSVE